MYYLLPLIDPWLYLTINLMTNKNYLRTNPVPKQKQIWQVKYYSHFQINSNFNYLGVASLKQVITKINTKFYTLNSYIKFPKIFRRDINFTVFSNCTNWKTTQKMKHQAKKRCHLPTPQRPSVCHHRTEGIVPKVTIFFFFFFIFQYNKISCSKYHRICRVTKATIKSSRNPAVRRQSKCNSTRWCSVRLNNTHNLHRCVYMSIAAGLHVSHYLLTGPKTRNNI